MNILRQYGIDPTVMEKKRVFVGKEKDLDRITADIIQLLHAQQEIWFTRDSTMTVDRLINHSTNFNSMRSFLGNTEYDPVRRVHMFCTTLSKINEKELRQCFRCPKTGPHAQSKQIIGSRVTCILLFNELQKLVFCQKVETC